MVHSNTKRGVSILGILLYGFIFILILSYFRISVREVVQSPTGQDNITYVQDTSKGFWERYLQEPAHYLWNDIWIELFWKSFISNMQRIRNGEPTDANLSAPQIQVQGNLSQ